jgi:putative ABC transport system permease protein
MLRNYLLIAIRSLTKHKFYSLINVIGLATGIAACLVIVLFIQNELAMIDIMKRQIAFIG